VELREYAESILYGPGLDAKLLEPGQLTDQCPGPVQCVPKVPGRSRQLAFGEQGGEGFRIPTHRALESESARGQVLHFFANHELLALELMAAVLLRFPEAPSTFRRGLVSTMQDEQRHLRLYLDRMECLGVTLGMGRLNRFFWDCLREMQSPMEFVAGMSLTFEQANLDFSRYWMERFSAIGDWETHALLQEVYDDEVRHVRHGLHWFRQWKPAGLTDLDAHQQALQPPLSLARAKGRSFDESGRLRAGLHLDYISGIRAFERSLGRPPRVWWFNPNAEREVELGGVQVEVKAQQLAADLTLVFGQLAHHDDCLLSSRGLTPTFRAYLRERGLRFPEVMVTEGLGAAQPDHQLLEALVPWSRSPAIPPQVVDWPFRAAPPVWKDSWRRFFSKSWSASHLRAWLEVSPDPRLSPLEDVGRVCRSLEEVQGSLGSRAMLVKLPYSTAGQERRRVFDGVMDAATERWVSRALARVGEVLVEPWLERVVDLSVQLSSQPSGLKVEGVSRFYTSPGGRYRGAWIGRWDRSLSPDLRRVLLAKEAGHSCIDRLHQAGHSVGEQLAADGFYGPFGVDAMLYRGQESLLLKPVVELNPRHTMGLVALGLRRLLAANCCGLWVLLSDHDLKQAGFTGFVEFSDWVNEALPTVLIGGRISCGSVWLTDPSQAERFVALMLVGEDPEALLEQWRRCVNEASPLSTWFA
jgi:uncharacterized ferritin-like protein (DUF455 family)